MKSAVASQNSAQISIAISIRIERSLILHSPTTLEAYHKREMAPKHIVFPIISGGTHKSAQHFVSLDDRLASRSAKTYGPVLGKRPGFLKPGLRMIDT